MRGQVYLKKGDYHDAEMDEKDAIAWYDAMGKKPENPYMGLDYRSSLALLATAYYQDRRVRKSRASIPETSCD